jgi:D-amino peptidase
MVAGAHPGADGSPTFDVALFVGYHTRAGHRSGTIAHTYSGMPVETRLDGRPTGEYGLNALVLGAWGIPVGMVAGDDGLAEEVEPWLPWAERVVVKTIDGGRSAISAHPSVARDRVRAGAERAVRRASAGELDTLRVGPPVAIEMDVPKGVIADHAAIMPGVERVGDRTVRFVHDDPETAYRGFLAIVRLVEPVSG